SIRLSSSTITIETREPQKRNWACRAGFHEHTSVSLHVPIPNNARGGDTRVHEDTAQSRHCQRAPEPSVVGLTASTPGILHFHSLCAVRTLCTAIVAGLWRLALHRLCGKGHDFVWSDAIQDAHFPWLSEGIRLLPEVFLGQTVH